jgi:hypothetical protein
MWQLLGKTEVPNIADVAFILFTIKNKVIYILLSYIVE